MKISKLNRKLNNIEHKIDQQIYSLQINDISRHEVIAELEKASRALFLLRQDLLDEEGEEETE